MDILSSSISVLTSLHFYKYLVLFPLIVIEGPILTIICGFLVSIGQLNFAIAYTVIVLADLTGDLVLYSLGRFSHGKTEHPIVRFLGITKERIAIIEDKIFKHPKKIFSIGKISHGLGGVVLFAAGAVKYSFNKFLIYNLIITIIKSIVLLFIGYHFGRAYASISHYLDYGAIALAIIFVAIYILFLRYTKSLIKKNENNSSNR